MKKRTTKRALAMSFFAMLLCCAMLIGTTYAWFTDSATSGKNTIIAGNLDIELKVWDAEKEDFVESTDALFGVDLWEPGVVAYETFQVENVGNLALKYDVAVNVIDKNTLNDHSLDEVIKVGVYAGDVGDMTRDDLVKAVSFSSFADTTARIAGTKLLPEATEVFTVVAYWEPTDDDNDYNVNNGQKTDDEGTELYIDFGIVVTATQAVHEQDSFDEYYDAAAAGGIDAVTAAIVKGAADSNAAIAEAIGTADLIYFDDALRAEGEELVITLHFEGEESLNYVNETYNAVKALIGAAVVENVSEIYSIKIALADERVLNGSADTIDENGDWVEKDLKTTIRAISTAGDITAALEVAAAEGLPVTITDINGVAQVYRMYFDLGWVTNPIDEVTSAIEQGATDANNALADAANGTIYFDDELSQDGENEYSITIHFGEGSSNYINEAYNAVLDLIGDAVVAQASNISTIQIVDRPAHDINDDITADEIKAFVEADLKAVISAMGGLDKALTAGVELGLPVYITDINGTTNTYTMNFDVDKLS